MAVTRWIFQDPVTSTSVTFPINPNDGGSPSYEHNFQYQNTAAPDGKVLVYEGRDNPQAIEFSGVLFTEDHFNMFVTWWQKRYQVNVTDDLGREFSIIIEKFVPKRERAIHFPWKHSYSVTATVVDWE